MTASDKSAIDAAFRNALAAAEQAGNSLWTESILRDWAPILINEARRERADPKSDAFRSAMEILKKYESYSGPRAAEMIVGLIERQGPPSTAARLEEYLRAYDAGFKECRSQDCLTKFELRLHRARYVIYDVPVSLTRPEIAEKDAQAALALAEKMNLLPKQIGAARGALGIARVSMAKRNGTAWEELKQLSKLALDDFRTAVKNAPDHRDRWLWHYFIAWCINSSDSLTTQLVEEALKNLDEGGKSVPPGGWRDNFESLRAALTKKADEVKKQNRPAP
jgi:hypothetical protein